MSGLKGDYSSEGRIRKGTDSKREQNKRFRDLQTKYELKD